MGHPDLGLPDGQVRLAPYAASWPCLYSAEAQRIRQVLGSELLDLQHVGSTAIPGMAAKPIIDIGAAVRSFESGYACIGPLQGLDYVYRGEHGIPGRHYFVKGAPRSYHLHMVAMGSAEWDVNLLFREALRADAALAKAYLRLKSRLAARFTRDRVRYTDGKACFVTGVLERTPGGRDALSRRGGSQ
ncbi:MAG: GrpB family protein [Myxococcota bacterium]